MKTKAVEIIYSSGTSVPRKLGMFHPTWHYNIYSEEVAKVARETSADYTIIMRLLHELMEDYHGLKDDKEIEEMVAKLKGNLQLKIVSPS